MEKVESYSEATSLNDKTEIQTKVLGFWSIPIFYMFPHPTDF